MNPLLKVYSFPRSGTHWFMSLLKARFYSTVDTGGLMSDFKEHRDFYGWDGLSEVSPWVGLLGGHYYHPNYAPLIMHGVYLVRDGLDTIYSVWRLRRDRWKSKEALGGFLRERQKWSKDPKNPVPDDIPIAVHWHWSTKLWLASDVPMVRYEELLENADRILKWLRGVYRLKDDRTFQHPKTPVGYLPSQDPGRGKSRAAFDRKDIEYFEGEAKEEAERLLARDSWYRSKVETT